MSHKVYEYFENKYVEDVDDVVLTNFFSFCRRKENGELYSDKYIKELYSLVNGTLKKAFAKGYIPCNPLDYGVKRPKGAVPNAQNRLVSEEDLALLLNAVQKNPRFKVMIPVLLLTGMRIGELLGLYWSDIDFDHGIISIRRAVSDSFTELPSGEIVKVV
jgi:integrase